MVLPWLVSAYACEPVALAQVEATLARAESAYAALDGQRFLVEMDTAAIELGCVADVVPTAVAARLHRNRGFAAFAARDQAHAAQSFAAARVLDPAYRLPADLFPEGHPLHAVYSAVAPVADRLPIPAPRHGDAFVDGAAAADHPVSRAFLFQVVGPDGVTTAYVYPGELLPPYDAVPTRRGKPLTVPMFVASGVAGLGAATCYGLAAKHQREFLADVDTVGATELNLLYNANRREVFLSVGLGGLGAALAVGGAVLVAW